MSKSSQSHLLLQWSHDACRRTAFMPLGTKPPWVDWAGPHAVCRPCGSRITVFVVEGKLL